MLRRRAFTAIELIVVIAILGILAVSAVPFGEFLFIREKEEELKDNLKDIRKAIARWRADCEKALFRQKGLQGVIACPESLLFPPDIGSLTKGGITATIKYPPGGEQFFFTPATYLPRIPIDPFVGAAIWTQHYASGTIASTTTYKQGIIIEDALGTLANSSGVFDVSPIASTHANHRGFVYSIEGSEFSTW